MTATCQLRCVSEGHVKILPKTSIGVFFHGVASRGRRSSPALLRAQGWDQMWWYGLTRTGHSIQTTLPSAPPLLLLKQAVFNLTATSQANRRAHMVIRGTDALPKGLWRTLSQLCLLNSYTANAWEAQEVQKDAVCVRVCLSQFSSDRAVKPATCTAATACQEVLLWFFCIDGRVDAWRATEAGEWRRGGPFGWLGWQGERSPSRREDGCPGPQRPRAEHCWAYSGGGRRLCSFLSSRPFQYLKLLSKCCIRLGRSAKAEETNIRSWSSVWDLSLVFKMFQGHYVLVCVCLLVS